LRVRIFCGTDSGNVVSEIIEDANNLIIPTITLYEVFEAVPKLQFLEQLLIR
jgi:hypothetical protein